MTTRIETDEGGATLIELLVAIALSGMLMAALAGAMITGLRTTRDTTTSLDQSNAEQSISTYVTRDVESADTVRASGTSSCGNQPIVLETTTKSSALSATDDVTVAYRLAGSVLTRQVCGGATPSTDTVAHDIASFSATGTSNVSITVATAASAPVGAYSWTVQVQRRPT